MSAWAAVAGGAAGTRNLCCQSPAPVASVYITLFLGGEIPAAKGPLHPSTPSEENGAAERRTNEATNEKCEVGE